MKLTAEQLEEVKTFVRSSDIKYIDVQMELLDHVACKVEDILERNPAQHIADALQQIKTDFGYHGFRDFQESFTKSVMKQNRNYYWEVLKEWFYMPKLLNTILVSVFLFLFFKTLGVKWASLSAAYGIAALALFVGGKTFLRYLKCRRLLRMKHVLGIPSLSIMYFWVKNLDTFQNNWYWGLAFSVLVTMSFLFIYASNQASNQAFERSRHLMNMYGQIKL